LAIDVSAVQIAGLRCGYESGDASVDEEGQRALGAVVEHEVDLACVGGAGSCAEGDGDDEGKALDLVKKYTDKKLSYHDALCASVMLRYRLYRVFTFDSDFWTFGFELLPGLTKPRKG